MKKFLILTIFTLSYSSFADTRFSCEPTAGANGNFSHLSKNTCNKKKNIDECRADFRCTPVKVTKIQRCMTESIAEDAVSGYEVIFYPDGTVGTR